MTTTVRPPHKALSIANRPRRSSGPVASARLSDEQWAFIRSQLPPHARTGRPRADDRRTLEGILYVLKTGCRWREMPAEYGSPITCWRRLREWEDSGAWERIWRAVLASLDDLSRLDWLQALYEGTFVPTTSGRFSRVS